MKDNQVNLTPENGDEEYEKKRKKGIILLFTIIGAVLLIGGAVYTGYYLYSAYAPEEETTTRAPQTVITEVETSDALIENPIDFDALQSENDEQFAWIQVPGTKVDYPICQSKTDDAFYLKHRASDKAYSKPGAIFIESHNTQTFNDRVTMIYGHNGYSDKMFASLHNFDKGEFFDEHEYFYIYTPTSKKTYEIYSVFKYDNRHIMNSFDFQENEVFLDFVNMTRNPDSTLKYTRDSYAEPFTLDSKFVILSTCVWHQNSNRFLVCGVLINDEKTY